MKNGDIYDIGQTVNGVSRFLYLEGKWYYARSLVYEYNYDIYELIKSISDDDSVKLGNIFTDDDLKRGLDFSECSHILSYLRNDKLNKIGI